MFEDVIMRPKVAAWLKVQERDIVRWLFWKKYGRRTPGIGDMKRLKDDMMDDDWRLIERARIEGRLNRWRLGDLWFCLKCRLASKFDDFNSWVVFHNSVRMMNRDADPEWEKRRASERLAKFERTRDPLPFEIHDAAMDYETIGERKKADECYRKILDSHLAGTKWDSPASAKG